MRECKIVGMPGVKVGVPVRKLELPSDEAHDHGEGMGMGVDEDRGVDKGVAVDLYRVHRSEEGRIVGS